ncbi:PhoH family protein [Nitrospira defluvii]|nr:PhoH family protein [Nitrospira defluvii]
MIEGAFSVKITARGEDLTIEGDRAEVEMAETAITDLSVLTNEGLQLTVEDVSFAIKASTAKKKENENVFQQSDQDIIPISGKKKSISPKSSAQKTYIDDIRSYDIVVGIGPAGTGKTYLAMAMAVSAYQKKEVDRIILARPAVEAGEHLGFLPGDLVEKINPYLRPLYDALYDMMKADQADRLLERGDIEIAPLAFMRGRTLNDAFVVLDEAQNATSEQMKMFLTRLGAHSKAVITGDITQIDLPPDRISGLIEIQKVLKDVPEIRFSYFTEKDVVRHTLVQDIVKAYENYEGKRKENRNL